MSNIHITVEVKAPEIADALEVLALALSNLHKAKPQTVPATAESERLAAKSDTTNLPENDKAVMEPKAESAEADKKSDKPTYTLVQVRERLATLSRAGKQAQVKALLEKFGASKLSEVKEEDYAALMEEAEAL